jgi:hypothetical protein
MDQENLQYVDLVADAAKKRLVYGQMLKLLGEVE